MPTGFEDLDPIPTYFFANNFWQGQRQILFHYSNCSYSQSEKFYNIYLSAPSIQSLPLAAWKTTAAKHHSICRSLWFLQILCCNAEAVSLQFFVYSRVFAMESQPKAFQGTNSRLCGFIEGKVFFFNDFSLLFGRFIYTWLEAWPARQNRETAKIEVITAIKNIMQYNRPEPTPLNYWQFCLWLLRKSGPIYSIFISPGECWEWSPEQ